MLTHPAFVDIVGAEDWALPGFRMHSCAARDQVACSAAAFGWTHFEKPMPQYFARAVQLAADCLVVDVGANTGFYTLLALSVSATVKVAAYEPLPAVHRILAANMGLNAQARRCTVHPEAVSHTAGPCRLYVPAGNHGLVETSASLNPHFKPAGGTELNIRAVTLDEQHSDGARVGVIKVDAEGHDFQVLRGAVGLLKTHRPAVFLEVLLGAPESDLTKLLQECGYADLTLLPDGEAAVCTQTRHHTLAWNHLWIPGEAASSSWSSFRPD